MSDEVGDGKNLVLTELGKLPLEAAMGEAHLERLAAIGTLEQYATGEEVFPEGEPADALRIVLDGRIALSVLVPGGGPCILGTLSRGDLLGWCSLKDDAVWQTTASASKPTRCLAFRSVEVRNLCDVDHELGYTLMQHAYLDLARRQGVNLDCDIKSDAALLIGPVRALLGAGIEVHCLRDATRGGLATVPAEIAGQSGLGARIWERGVPVREAVADACELLGLDPLYVAREGCFATFVPATQAEQVLAVLRQAGCPDAALLGEIVADPEWEVVLESVTGGERVLDVPFGELRPVSVSY